MNVSISHPTDRPNFTRVWVGDLGLWFSYETVIAFNGPNGLVVSENLWSVTTGGHLNYIDGGSAAAKANRLSRSDFEDRLQSALDALGLSV